MAINLLLNLSELAGNVGSMAVKHRAVSVGDLGSEVSHATGRLILGVGSNISSLNVLDGNVLDIEANVVSGNSLGKGLVVHLNRLHLSGQLVGGKGDNNARLDDSGLNPANGHCSNTSNFVDILKGKPEGLVGGPCWRDDGIKN